MQPPREAVAQIDALGKALAEALGDAVRCIAVYGSAAGDGFVPGHSDVNLLLVLREVRFADLRLIGETLRRTAPRNLVVATPLVVRTAFLRDARDSYPIELADIHDRHRVLAGEDLLGSLSVSPERLREQAEREARGKVLKLRALVIHRPPDAEMQRVLASVVPTLEVIERALLRAAGDAAPGRGAALFEEVSRRQDLPLPGLTRLARLRTGQGPWPAGHDLDDLLAAVLHEVEALVAWIDEHPA